MTSEESRGPGSGKPRGSDADIPGPATGEETREIVSEVLREQAERQARQRDAGQRKKNRRLPLPILAVILAAASLYVWVAAPSWLLPEPLPEPTAVNLQDGLRMEMYGLVVQIERYRQENGRIPASLEQAAEEGSPDVTYVPFPPESYRLEGRRAGTEIVYSSGEPARTLLGNAPERIRGVAGASSS